MSEVHIGFVAVLLAAAVLALAVTRELAPAGGLTGRGRWLLGLALGAGVLAFALKLGLLAAAGAMSHDWLHSPQQAAPASRSTEIESAQRELSAHYRWQSLPREAPSPQATRRQRNR